MPPTTSNPLIKISVPTRVQAIHGLERVLLIFVTVTSGYWLKTADPFSKAALVGAAWAGGTAVYQAILSTVTTL